MNKKPFHLHDSSLQYFGMFARPAFSLWRDRATLIETTYNLFSPFDVDIEDISFESDGGSLDEEAISITLNGLGEFKFGYKSIFWFSENDTQKDLADIFEVIAHVNDKLPSLTADLKFDHHITEFGGHGGLKSGDSFRDFLQKYHEPKLKSVNLNLPNGLLYNWLDENKRRQFHFEIDESLDVPGNLFMRWVIFFRKDKVELSDLNEGFFNTLKSVLNELDLELED